MLLLQLMGDWSRHEKCPVTATSFNANYANLIILKSINLRRNWILISRILIVAGTCGKANYSAMDLLVED